MKTISTKQLIFSVSTFIISSSLLTKGVYSFTGNESWLTTIFGILTSLPILFIYVTLAKNHPGSSIIEINDDVFGKILGKIISFLYVFYFFSLVILNTNDLGNFIQLMILPNTPILVIYAVFLLVCAMAVGKGPHKLTSYGTTFTIVTIFIVVVHAFLLLNLVKPENLLPVFTKPIRSYLLGTHIVTMMPYCEIIVFLMFLPFIDDARKLRKGLIRGLLIGSGVLLVIVLRDITVQGAYLEISAQTTFSTIRLIDVGDVLTRLDIIYAVTLLTLYFFKISTVYFAAVSGFARMTKIGQYKYLVYIFGALAVIYANAVFQSPAEHIKWKMSAAATYSTFFILVLPLITLIVSELRRRPSQGKPDSMEKTGTLG